MLTLNRKYAIKRNPASVKLRGMVTVNWCGSRESVTGIGLYISSPPVNEILSPTIPSNRVAAVWPRTLFAWFRSYKTMIRPAGVFAFKDFRTDGVALRRSTRTRPIDGDDIVPSLEGRFRHRRGSLRDTKRSRGIRRRKKQALKPCGNARYRSSRKSEYCLNSKTNF